MYICTTCNKIITRPNYYQRKLFKEKNIIYHIDGCGWNSEIKIKNTKIRMKNNNPMSMDGVINKVKISLKKIGHKPRIQGGNGRGESLPQKILHDKLGSKWISEYSVPTKLKREDGFPYHYKIDLANPSCKIAIEIDGSSHSSFKQKEKDLKKNLVLMNLGWKVLRFSNEKVLKEIDHVLKIINEA